PAPPPRAVDYTDGNLARLDRDRRPHLDGPTPTEKLRWHRQLAHIARERGYRPGWAAYKFKERFDHWPGSNTVAPEPPRPEVSSWVRSRQIAYAKAMQKAAQS